MKHIEEKIKNRQKANFELVRKLYYQYIEGGRWNIEARPSIAGYNNKLVPAWSLHRLIEMYTEHYVCEHINLKLLTYDTIIENIRLDILSGTFNKEYLN